MNYLRPICAASAIAYCIFLGIFSLAHKNRTSLHVNFALYNFSCALYNMADYVFLFSSYSTALYWNRFSGLGGCLMMPFFMRFVLALLETPDAKAERWVTPSFYVGIVISVLYVTTPLFIAGLVDHYRTKVINVELAGPLYPIFIVYVAGGLLVAVYRVLLVHRRTQSPLLRKKLRYVALAIVAGFIALLTYFLSFVWLDLPLIYYTLQALVAFIFSYAIFRHDLVPISLAVRRFMLVGGIYLLLGVIISPVFLFSYRFIFETQSAVGLVVMIFSCGLFFSLGPFFYSRMVRRSSLFQDTQAFHLTHEFKSPLGAIQSAKEILTAELAKPDPNPLRIQEYMDMIQRNAARLETFVGGILNVAKAEDSERTLAKANVDLGLLIEDVVKHFPNERQTVQLKVASETVLSGDAEALRQVFTNLIANAFSSCPEGNIEISIERQRESVQVSIRDHGRGIPADDLERIFEPFARSKQNVSAKSTGLGLAIAERWVRAHNGRIWAESEGEGKGATFHVQLPLQ